jgi:hypothetical protein
MLIFRRTAARRLPAAAALATAVCVLSAPLAAILHESNVRHVECALDGELVDAAPPTAAELAAPEHHHARTVAERGESFPVGLSHEEHCGLASWSHQRSTAAHANDSVVAATPVDLVRITATPDRRPPAIALYRLAPKLSPPLA